MTPRFGLAALLAILAMASGVSCGDVADAPKQTPESTQDTPRNPFGLPQDVEDCCGADVDAFAEQASPMGDPGDPNAEPWAGTSDAENYASIEGEWASRWKLEDQDWVEGRATVRISGDRVFIHYTDQHEYLLEAERRGDRLIGRYVSFKDALDTSPWVGNVVDNRRIDGVYLKGRWDFRRAEAAPARE